jgi:hypothetical protein
MPWELEEKIYSQLPFISRDFSLNENHRTYSQTTLKMDCEGTEWDVFEDI